MQDGDVGFHAFAEGVRGRRRPVVDAFSVKDFEIGEARKVDDPGLTRAIVRDRAKVIRRHRIAVIVVGYEFRGLVLFGVDRDAIVGGAPKAAGGTEDQR